MKGRTIKFLFCSAQNRNVIMLIQSNAILSIKELIRNRQNHGRQVNLSHLATLLMTNKGARRSLVTQNHYAILWNTKVQSTRRDERPNGNPRFRCIRHKKGKKLQIRDIRVA